MVVVGVAVGVGVGVAVAVVVGVGVGVVVGVGVAVAVVVVVGVGVGMNLDILREKVAQKIGRSIYDDDKHPCYELADYALSLLAEAQRESWLAALDWRETRLGFVNGMSVRQREAAEAEASRRFPIPGDKA